MSKYTNMNEPREISEELAKEILNDFSGGNFTFMNNGKRMCGAFYSHESLYELDFYGHVAVLSFKDSDVDYTTKDLHDNIKEIALRLTNVIVNHSNNYLPEFTSHGPLELVIEFFKSEYK